MLFNIMHANFDKYQQSGLFLTTQKQFWLHAISDLPCI